MKNRLLSLLLLCAFCACQTKQAPVIVNGIVNNTENSTIEYSAVINQACNGYFKKSLVPDSTGHFSITIPIDAPCFFGLHSYQDYKEFIIEPGKTYEVEIGEKNAAIQLHDKSNAQLFYENLPSSSPNAVGFFREDISNYQTLRDSLQLTLANELRNLDTLSCSEATRQLIAADRKVYYHLALASLAAQLNVRFYHNKEKTPDAILQMWKEAVSEDFMTDPINQKSGFYYNLLGLNLGYRLYTNPDYDATISKIRKEKREQGLELSYHLELAKQLLPAELTERYSASYIQVSARQDLFEKELISLFDQFKSDYPNSPYTSYISPSIDKVADFYDRIEKGPNGDYEFFTDSENINSLTDCLAPFRGRKVYVDIWATWCGWCKKEFAYQEKLKETLKKKGVEVLYISLDRDELQNRWMNMIKYYEIDGKHLRASKALKADLKEKLGRYGIPRYLIVDEQGNIVNDKAPRPSHLSELEPLL